MQGIKFEKVSKEEFKKAIIKNHGDVSDALIDDAYNHIILPTRATDGSAGYDIYCPFSFVKYAKDTLLTETGIRAIMPQGVALIILPRSGLGFKTAVRLSNTLGLIDSDYQFADNEGHIMIKLYGGEKDLEVAQNDRIAQAVFIPYYTTEDDKPLKASRSGGLGSTGK